MIVLGVAGPIDFVQAGASAISDWDQLLLNFNGAETVIVGQGSLAEDDFQTVSVCLLT